MKMNENTTPDTDDGRIIEGDITEVKSPDASLIVLKPAEYATELFKPFNEELAAEKRKRIRYDIQTTEGMAKAKDVLGTLVKIRTRAEKAKSAAKKPIDQAGKEILSQWNTLEAAVKAEEKKHAEVIEAEKKRIADLEAEKQRLERARIEAIEARLDHIRGIPGKYAKADAATLQVVIDELLAKQLDPALYDEHLEAAAQAMIETVDGLRQLHTDAIASEGLAAELARLRAEDEQRKATAAAAEKIQAEAAAALKAQQDQMAAIVEVQGLAAALSAAGQTQDRAAIEAALAKVEAFDPADYGAMAPMATLARDAARPLLLDLLVNLPAPVVVGVDPGAPEGDRSVRSVVVPIEADGTGVIIGAALVSHGQPGPDARIVENLEPNVGGSGGSYPPIGMSGAGGKYSTGMSGGGRVVPKTTRPSDLAIVELVAHHYDVSNMTAHSWLATFDVEAARVALAGA